MSDENKEVLVTRPRYDRAALRSRIVHLGFGAFHRAHQAVYTDVMLNAIGGDWGHRVVKLKSGAEALQRLAENAYLYTVLKRDSRQGDQARIVGSVIDHRHPETHGREGVVAGLADAGVEIVSLTVTEKGYMLTPGGRLDLDHPEVKADLADQGRPGSAIGVLVAALAERRRQGLKPFTILCCDNLPDNGARTRDAVLAFAGERDADLAAWIEGEGRFPSTMVDRIVPATTPETEARIFDVIGRPDPDGVACEPFRQWVIEDDFVGERPAWDVAGATFTRDVAPFEMMKLRMLNGPHSFLAYLGYLGGFETIADTMADLNYAAAARALMLGEQAASFAAPEGIDLTAYADELIARFTNRAIRHRTWQIAMDGSQKLPQRMLSSLQWHVEHGRPAPLLTLGVAAWIRYVGGIDERGQAIDVRDPMAARLKADGSETPVERVRAVVETSGIFPPRLAGDGAFLDTLSQALGGLIQDGAVRSVAKVAGESKR
ncbi:hypothetical protein LQ948_11595 [Jiella sp. MQZ9-1]|uniref:Fructuronate reductase n=1 Tax=Jiella flava TaxID=2816857 RepID=A0A939JWQ2_9HYPH|nr:hypothetical protein [Jiella flava]MBO0663277.1 hypothetical protein [Jiella flava]MCD2471853.1 hypothetical protein [Jiella flava]